MPDYDVSVVLPKNKKNPLYKLNSSDWHNDRFIPAPANNFTSGELKTIKFLLKNPRASYTEIGRNTAQSYETIRQQVRKFVEKKYLGNFGIFPNFNKFGTYANYVFLNVESLDDTKFGQYVRNNGKIFYAAKLIGKYNVLLYFVSKHPSELHEEIRKLRNVFSNNILALEMLSFDEIHKSVQFPTILFDETE
jgi:DNA-binding Lrp family transcriptional regulator